MRSLCLVLLLAGPSTAPARPALAHRSRAARTSRVVHPLRGDAGHALRSTRIVRAERPRPSSPEPIPTPWSQFRAPTSGLSQSIGGYAGGCIDGAVPLPLAGDGFRVVHPDRNRVFGHPQLIDVIRDLGARLVERKLPAISVGDLGQPRGGPTPGGHASHQTGLDVDIWFVPPWLGRPLSMVDAVRRAPSPLFDDEVIATLELAASDARVERIFINPVLKRAICERSGLDHVWLRKLRPWYGHDDHFHVRVACPADSPTCVAQEPLPPGDGCDQLGAWLRKKTLPERGRPRALARATPPPPTEPAANLPNGCRALLDPSPPSRSAQAAR